MKHICEENGCRLVTDEEYERLMKIKKAKEELAKRSLLPKKYRKIKK